MKQEKRELLRPQQDNSINSRGSRINPIDGGYGLQTLVQSMCAKRKVFSHILLCQKRKMSVVDKTPKDMASVDMGPYHQVAGTINKESERALTG